MNLKPILDELYESYLADFQRSPVEFFLNRQDPLAFAHRYQDFHDVEAAAFLASTFAYGRVQSLCAFVEKLLAMLEPSPYQFLRQGPDAVDTLGPRSPYYRLHKTPEILGVLSLMAAVYKEHDSLYSVFLKSYDERSTMNEAMGAFVRRLYEIHGQPIPFLIPSPESGSPCKRLNLFLRWMVRNDGLDLGIWKDVSPRDLMIPLDTHIGRVALKLGWIATPSLTWKKAEEITKILREFNPDDPIRYDFSLCHESISRSSWLREVVRGRTRKPRTRNSTRNNPGGKARYS